MFQKLSVLQKVVQIQMSESSLLYLCCISFGLLNVPSQTYIDQNVDIIILRYVSVIP